MQLTESGIIVYIHVILCLLFKTEILLCIKMYKYLPCKKWILHPCQSLSRSGKSEEEKKSIRNYTSWSMLQLTYIQQYTLLVLWYLLHVAVRLWTISNFAILSQNLEAWGSHTEKKNSRLGWTSVMLHFCMSSFLSSNFIFLDCFLFACHASQIYNKQFLLLCKTHLKWRGC